MSVHTLRIPRRARGDELEVELAGRSDLGRVRTDNEDQFLIATIRRTLDVHATSLNNSEAQIPRTSPAQAILLVVADGVSGHWGASKASGLAIETVVDYMTNTMRCVYDFGELLEERQLYSDLRSSIEQSDRAIRAAGQTERPGTRMSTTLTMVYLAWPRAYIAHVGDSRCYHFRAGVLSRVTRDQTFAQAMIDAGVLSESEAEASRLKDILSSAVGSASGHLDLALSRLEIQNGDTLLLCTDGLTRHVPDAEIEAVLNTAAPVDTACQTLIDRANANGGTDNITAVVAHIPRARRET